MPDRSHAGENRDSPEHIPLRGPVLRHALEALGVEFPPTGGGVTDHGALTGLPDDDHPQYAKVAAGAFTTLAPTSAVAAAGGTNELVRQVELDATVVSINDNVDTLVAEVYATIDAKPTSAWTAVSLSSTFSTTSTSNTSVTGLLFTPKASKSYVFEAYLMLRADVATTGPRPGVSMPTGLTDGAYEITAPNSNTSIAFRNQGALGSAQNAASSGVPTTTDSYMARITGIVIAGSSVSGNVQVTLASEVAASQVHMRAGSVLLYREIPALP